MLCRKLRWICRKHSNDVARQVEEPSKATIFVSQQIYVALDVTLYHGWKTRKYRHRCISGLTVCEVLRPVAPFSVAFVRYIIKNLQVYSNFLYFSFSLDDRSVDIEPAYSRTNSLKSGDFKR